MIVPCLVGVTVLLTIAAAAVRIGVEFCKAYRERAEHRHGRGAG
ncbi:hypothetical protein [Streptomyces cadmiisoli]|nr:hypothetical protein [Streptomyces cadmiisoli]